MPLGTPEGVGLGDAPRDAFAEVGPFGVTTEEVNDVSAFFAELNCFMRLGTDGGRWPGFWFSVFSRLRASRWREYGVSIWALSTAVPHTCVVVYKKELCRANTGMLV